MKGYLFFASCYSSRIITKELKNSCMLTSENAFLWQPTHKHTGACHITDYDCEADGSMQHNLVVRIPVFLDSVHHLGF
jgi:hypothetical protein